MTWWKHIFDAKYGLGRYYGRVTFIEADDRQSAEVAARAAAQRDYRDCTIETVGLGESTAVAAAQYHAAKAQEAAWRARTRLTQCPVCRQPLPAGPEPTP